MADAAGVPKPGSQRELIRNAIIAAIVPVVIGIIAAQAGGYIELPGRVTLNEAEFRDLRDTIEERSKEAAKARADAEARLRSLEDDNRDQRSQIKLLQDGLATIAAKQEAGADEFRRAFQALQASQIRIETKLESIRGASEATLPREAPAAPVLRQR